MAESCLPLPSLLVCAEKDLKAIFLLIVWCSYLQAGGNNGNSMEFPTTNLYELEGRVFTETWSIPYKREDSLGKCLIAAARLAEEGMFQ